MPAWLPTLADWLCRTQFGSEGRWPMLTLSERALSELNDCLNAIDAFSFDAAIAEIASAHSVALYGVGREGLQTKGLAMRLFHLGLKTAVVGDMTAPAIGHGDLLIVSAGPGEFATVCALMRVARAAGARILLFTAEPNGEAASLADHCLHVPGQTMARAGMDATSVLPLGSLYEGALFVLFELMILALCHRLGVTMADMSRRHTNLE
jgi:6-phospho-3-hexuloisomerase